MELFNTAKIIVFRAGEPASISLVDGSEGSRVRVRVAGRMGWSKTAILE